MFTNPIDDDLCFKYDLLTIIRRLHDICTGLGGDPGKADFDEVEWLQWKLSVWKTKTMISPIDDEFSNIIKTLAESALREFKNRWF